MALHTKEIASICPHRYRHSYFEMLLYSLQLLSMIGKPANYGRS
jgi:hypothetical protein